MQATHKTVDRKTSRVYEALKSDLLESLLNNAETSEALRRRPYLLKVILLQLILGYNLDSVVSKYVVCSYHPCKEVIGIAKVGVNDAVPYFFALVFRPRDEFQ